MKINEGVELVRAAVSKPRDIVFVVGAGVSVTAGFPLWDAATSAALTRSIALGLSPGAASHAQELLASKNYYQVFTVLKMSLTAATYRNIVLDAFGRKQAASETQKLLVAAPARGVITTNFDECLTSANVLVRGEPPLRSIPDILSSDAYFVAQIHGSLDDPKTMVLTTEDWQTASKNENVRSLLEQVVSRNQIIFLGYSMSDPDFGAIWADMLANRVFRQPSLYCCSEGATSPERVEELRKNNVQVIEFENNGNYAFVSEILKAISTTNSKDTDEPAADTAIASTIADLERYVSLCLEFSSDRNSRLLLILKAIVLEMLVDHQHSASIIELSTFATSVLGEHSETITASMSAALSALESSEMIRNHDGRYTLRDDARAVLSRRVSEADKSDTASLARLLDESAIRNNVPREELSVEILRDLVDRALLSIGINVAEFFLYGKPAVLANDEIETIISSSPISAIPKTQKIAYGEALRRFIVQPSSEDEAAVFHRLQSYFITSAFVLSPTSERLMCDYAAGHIIYLDSSLILPALANGHPSQNLYSGLLADTKRLGMKLRVSRGMLNEIFSNVASARRAFWRYGKDGLDLQDVISGYVLVQGKGNGNVFLEGFLAQLEMDPTLRPDIYMKIVMNGKEPLTERQLASVLRDRFQIDLDEADTAELDEAEVDRVTNSIEHLRKMGKRFKTRLLCRHEALEFALLHLRRKQRPDLESKIWFITTDYFFVELQRLERTKYPAPVSYTPRLWFQYLDLIDTEVRGSRHFSRLQSRMKYGVATGELGMAAIDMIVREKKALISRGLVTVKEMAKAIVDNYHVRNAIEAYEFGTRSGAPVSRQTVEKSISNAVSGIVTLRVQEVEVLKSEKSDALNRAALLEKQLAKEKYVNRFLKRGTIQKRRRSR